MTLCRKCDGRGVIPDIIDLDAGACHYVNVGCDACYGTGRDLRLLKIPRNRWLRGSESGLLVVTDQEAGEALRRKQEPEEGWAMCALGFFWHSLGVPLYTLWEDDVLLRSSWWQLDKVGKAVTANKILENPQTFKGWATSVCLINDARGLLRDEREASLTGLFREVDVDLQFVGTGTP